MAAKKYIKILAITLVALCSATIFYRNVLAEGSSGTGDGDHSGSSGPCTTGVCYSKSKGGGWASYPVTSDHIVIPNETLKSGETYYGGSLDGCQSVGATNYLRLAPALFDSNGYVRQMGLMTVSDFENEGWTYNLAVGGISRAAAYKAFLAADAADGVRDGLVKGNTWGGTSAFCYKEGDEVITHDGDTQFWTKSSVSVGSSYITGGKTVTSEKNGKVTLEFSTDDSSVTVDFSHIVGYDHGSFTMESKDTTSGDAVTTKWSVSDAYTVGEHSSSTWRPGDDHEETPDAAKKSVTIDFGDSYGTKEKCSTIKYTRRNVSLKGTPVIECSGWSCWVDHYDYSATYSGSQDSEACVKVTRPEPPTPPNGGPENPGGEANSKIMFAGEDTSLIWKNISAKSYKTRRLSSWQSIKFQVNHSIPYDSAKFQKDSNSKPNPCTMYKTRFSITDNDLCKVHESGSWDTTTSKTHSHNYGGGSVEANVKVPDYVGNKYCNSFGYSFEYWYIINGDEDTTKNGEHHDSPKDYWYNFGAACRTIAKKPTTAAWNGSVMTMGNISTSLASRHNSITFGDIANDDRTLYGSWSEYLVVANVNLNSSRTMASGSSLSKGSTTLKLCDGQPWSSNSSLTISNFSGSDTNVCQLTPSGVTSNTTFMTRLNAYLRDVENNPNITKTSNIGDLYGGVHGNMVLTVNGDLKIEQNITISDSTSYGIHNVPQAVIFVNNGNVDISENVDRIDAWLIVTGTKGSNTGIVNTCAGFTPGTNVDVTSDGSGFSGNRCTKQLAFNGPVIARKMNLQRSYGSDPLISRTGTFGTSSYKETPAEIFNLRADSYLWAYAQAARYGSSYSEAYSRELAPRY